MRATVAATIAIVGLAVLGRDAWAQSATVGPPVVAPLVPGAGQDAALQPDARDALALEPLRLSLLARHVPHRFGEPGCTDQLEASGTATGQPGFPLMGAAALGIPVFGRRASWRTPRLTLSGFSRGGCAYDAAVGGGATLTIPLTKTVFFAWGGGAIYLPKAGPGGAAVYEGSVRADVVFQRPGGGAFMVGVGAIGGGPRVSVGGVF